ncbi:uncharacterized protein METZ01_LOCUS303946 [marine metagenome]|uniref:Uncharacterized protein n=1 Tax=marine metagenome TaxID=408172 RepID=A0A382MUB9_9ZZZZ
MRDNSRRFRRFVIADIVNRVGTRLGHRRHQSLHDIVDMNP